MSDQHPQPPPESWGAPPGGAPTAQPSPPAPAGGPAYPAHPPVPGQGPMGPGGGQGPVGPGQPVHPMAGVADVRLDMPLHPLLPNADRQAGADAAGSQAHQSPHAASAGPQDGARGAMWFAVVVAIIVVCALLGAFVLAVAS